MRKVARRPPRSLPRLAITTLGGLHKFCQVRHASVVGRGATLLTACIKGCTLGVPPALETIQGLQQQWVGGGSSMKSSSILSSRVPCRMPLFDCVTNRVRMGEWQGNWGGHVWMGIAGWQGGRYEAAVLRQMKKNSDLSPRTERQ